MISSPKIPPPPPPPAKAPATALKFFRVERSGINPRLILNAVEGWGKTTFGAFAPNPAILMAEGETGYVTLRGANLVPDADCIELKTWNDVLHAVDGLTEKCEYETLVFDAMGGFEKLCHKHVCARDFNNDWGDKGFLSFHKGYSIAVNDWLTLLARLDNLRAKNKTKVILLSHAAVKNFKNPAGPDFDRYIANVHETTWSATARWADAVLFGNFVTVVDQQTQIQRKAGKGKGIGGADRIVYTERRDAWDAKNRYGMPEEVDIPADPTQVWSTIWTAITSKQSTQEGSK
jgi:hypothetical protein